MGSGGEAPWKPALFKNLNHNLYGKLIWDYYKIGCVIFTESCSTYQFANLGDAAAYVFRFFLYFLFFLNAEKWCGQSRTGRSGSDAPAEKIL